RPLLSLRLAAVLRRLDGLASLVLALGFGLEVLLGALRLVSRIRKVRDGLVRLLVRLRLGGLTLGFLSGFLRLRGLIELALGLLDNGLPPGVIGCPVGDRRDLLVAQ